MTIAEQVAQCFLESIEKTINGNKMDVGALESNTYYRSEKAKMVVTDTKTGIVIATMTCDMNPKRRKQEKDLDDYCRKRVCPVCIFKNQEPCITNKIAYGVATNKEVEENYKKMLEEVEMKE